MMNILDRTFGLEIEIADVEKSKVALPYGYSWSEDEIVHNTDGTKGRFISPFGGEINTPPLRVSHSSLIELCRLYSSLVRNGGKITRELSIQVHIYIGDLELEEIKKIFYLLYYTSKYIDEVCYVSPYSKFTIFTPSPTTTDYEKVKNACTFEALRSVFENSTNKGFIRHIVNISSYFKRKTVEFRPFWGTTDINEVVSCILFSYRFVNYALTHNESDFSLICDTEDFRRKLKLYGNYPNPMPPLLFFGNPLDMKESLNAKAIRYTGAMTKTFIDNTPDMVSMVNPALFSFELSIAKNKKIIIYNNDELNHIIYLISTGALRLEYIDKASFLQSYNSNDACSQLTCLLVFRKIQQYLKDNDFCKKSLKAIVESLGNTIIKAKVLASKIIDLISRSDYRLGTVNDAISDGGCVFFQFDDYSKNRNIVSKLRKYSNYSLKFQKKQVKYYGLTENIPDNTILTLYSYNSYINLNKVAYISGVYFYSSAKVSKELFSPKITPKLEFPVFIDPPDDLIIEDPRCLSIKKVQSLYYKQAQEKYIVKVHKIPKSVKFCFFVYYDRFLIGGFGFEWTKDKEYDIWLMSDFVTNNKIARLSKLVLLCLKSNIVKTYLSRLMVEDISSCYTKVYTSNPVSMKYRGLFRKIGRRCNHLIYDTQLGTVNGYNEIISNYRKYVSLSK